MWPAECLYYLFHSLHTLIANQLDDFCISTLVPHTTHGATSHIDDLNPGISSNSQGPAVWFLWSCSSIHLYPRGGKSSLP